VAIDVEVGYVAVHPLAHMVGQPANGQHIRRTVKRQPVVEVEPLTGQHLWRRWILALGHDSEKLRYRGKLLYQPA